MRKKFICIAGKNDISVNVLEYFVNRKSENDLGIVCNRTETGMNTFQKSLRWFAKRYEINEYILLEVYGIENQIFCPWNLINWLNRISLRMPDCLIFIFSCFQNTKECLLLHFQS